jgi:acyl transferase domain-containing protein/surfactin synthase thioesterase subunit/aryl carrier-like protein
MDAQKEKLYAEKLKKSILAIQKLQSEIEELKKNGIQNEPIAIVGMACRFPGSSNTPEQLWDLLKNGRSATTEIPGDRWDINKYFDPAAGTPGKTHTKYGGFIDNIDKFDNLFFGISNREALLMDPLHRLLLEVSFEAMEDAGFNLEELNGVAGSVYVGFGDNTEYASKHILSNNFYNIDPYSLTGYMTTAASGRISYLLGLEGGNVSLSTGCSSSLVATHLACQSLRNREADMAIAGGANLIISPGSYIALSNMEAISPDGKCKSFDASADGYGRSDGVGVIVLKRLSDAIKNKDFIWAVIKGTAINQDGKSNGFTAPSVQAQEKVIASALKNAGLTPNDVDFVEAHGTGTRIGDPIEMEAIKNAYCKKRTTQRPLYVGTIKSNFGHSEGAAGIAGIIKVVLALKNKQIPANLNFTEPNPLIPWDEMNVTIPTKISEWVKEEGIRTGAVSAFGISGTNAHIVLQEFQQTFNSEDNSKSGDVYVLPFSAKSNEALKDYAVAYINFLRQNEQSKAFSLRYICTNAALKRTHYATRQAVCGASQQEIIQQLDAIVQNGISAQKLDNPCGKVVFVFPGQGSQWLGMGKELISHNDIFRKTIEQCEIAFNKHVSWKLSDVMEGKIPSQDFEEIDLIQPALFAVEVALAEMWKSIGIVPDAVIGHSMGEVAAAYSAGIINMEDAAGIICTRSRLLKKIKGQGRMLATDLNYNEAIEWTNNYPNISLAVNNGPQSTVLSGDPSSLEEIARTLESKERFARFVKVDVASHSPQTDQLLTEFKELVKQVDCKQSPVKFYSTVKGGLITSTELGVSYWAENIRKPVLFAQTISQMLEQQYIYFVEVSPHPVLQAPVEQILDAEQKQGLVIASLKREEPERLAFMQNYCRLYSAGYNVDWSKIYEDKGNFIKLPTYPWQKTRFWLDTPTPGDSQTSSINLQSETNELLSEVNKSILEWIEYSNTTEKINFIKSYISHQLMIITGYTEQQLNANTMFNQLGIDSMMIMRLKRVLEKELKTELSIRNMMQHPSIEKLATYLVGHLSDGLCDSELDSVKNEEWFIIPNPNPEAKYRIFLFHDAGGSSSLYTNWSKHLSKVFEIVLLEMPGRGHRIGEKYITDMALLINKLSSAIQPFLNKPFLFFGHSMGGEIAFELVRELNRTSGKKPLSLIISSAQCFNGTTKEINEHKLPEKELTDLFPALKKENFDDEEFYRFAVNTLRADLKLLSTYKYKQNGILDIPITILWAEDDTIVDKQGAERWKNETSSTFRLVLRKGGHRYIDKDVAFVISLIEETAGKLGIAKPVNIN